MSLNMGFITDFLIGYKQGNTENPASSVRKFDISIAFFASSFLQSHAWADKEHKKESKLIDIMNNFFILIPKMNWSC